MWCNQNLCSVAEEAVLIIRTTENNSDKQVQFSGLEGKTLQTITVPNYHSTLISL